MNKTDKEIKIIKEISPETLDWIDTYALKIDKKIEILKEKIKEEIRYTKLLEDIEEDEIIQELEYDYIIKDRYTYSNNYDNGYHSEDFWFLDPQ